MRRLQGATVGDTGESPGVSRGLPTRPAFLEGRRGAVSAGALLASTPLNRYSCRCTVSIYRGCRRQVFQGHMDPSDTDLKDGPAHMIAGPDMAKEFLRPNAL